jgi:hypothetical protein
MGFIGDRFHFEPETPEFTQGVSSPSMVMLAIADRQPSATLKKIPNFYT